MHIAVNMVGDKRWMGGVIYVRNLLQALNSLPVEERCRHKVTLVVYPHQIEIQDLARPLADAIYYPSFFFKASKRLPVAVRKYLGFLANPRHFDFMFPVLEPYGYPFPYAGWIPDFQHVYMQQFFERDEIKQTELKYRAIAQSPLVVLSSRMALDDFTRLYPDRAPKGRVLNFVSYAEPSYFEGDPVGIQRKYDLPDAFFLVSNQFWKHKNHELVVDAVAALASKGVKPCVVCTGSTEDHRDPGYFDSLTERMREAGVFERFRFLGLIPRSDQMNLMRRCLAVIQPSLFEGWSTVAEDARSLGKPMLLSDFPVHVEQNPPHSRYFPRHDPAALAECMREALSSLQPGPDTAAEAGVRERNDVAMREFARAFLAIASEATGAERRAGVVNGN